MSMETQYIYYSIIENIKNGAYDNNKRLLKIDLKILKRLLETEQTFGLQVVYYSLTKKLCKQNVNVNKM